MSEKETVARFIDHVREVDRIKITIDLAGHAHVVAYRFKIACNEEKTVDWWLENHIREHLPEGTVVKVYDKTDKLAGGYVALKHLRRA